MTAECHQLETIDGKTSFFSGRGKTAWHTLGNVIEGLANVEEALKFSGLDWEATKEPVYQAIKREGGGPSYKKIEDKYAVTRSSDNKVLGVVGGDYTICNNREAFQFMDNMIDSGEAVFDTAGSMFGGKRVFMSALLPSTIETVYGDEHETYLLFSNSFDGSKAINLDVTNVRVVCRNTQIMAQSAAKTSWKLRHTTSLEGRLQEAMDALKIAHKVQEDFQKMAEQLIELTVDEDTFKAILEASFPEQKTQKEKNIEAVLDNLRVSETIPDDLRATGYGAYNALTEWVSWEKAYRTDEARVKSVVGGWGAGIVNRTTSALLSLAK